MDGKYEVLLGHRCVGNVQVFQEGLYSRFCCRCELPGDVVCRLTVSCGDSRENLGILMPKGGSFCLEKKIPTKRLGQGTPIFRVVPNRAVITGEFVPIYPEEPFTYLERLKDAYLAHRDGQVGVVIQNKAGT